MADGMIKQSVRKLRAMRPAQVRTEALRPFHLELIGADEADRQALSQVFIPDRLGGEERANAIEHIATAASGRAEVRVCTPLAASGHLDADVAVVDWRAPTPGLVALLRAYPNYRLALGRAFPALRDTLARELILAVAARNAAVAAISALPEVIPNPLSLLLALGEMGSDTVVLTANQIALGFELAALRGAEVGWRAQSRSIATIIAGGLGWRTLARELVGLIPAGVGLAAKTAIAYSGTMAVGTALWRMPNISTTRRRPPMAYLPTRTKLARPRQSA